MIDETGNQKEGERNRGDEEVNSPLMAEIEHYAGNISELKRMAAKFLPFTLICALQNSSGLQELKAIVTKYPELKSTVVECAAQLRQNEEGWKDHGSPEYKKYIISLSKQLDK